MSRRQVELRSGSLANHARRVSRPLAPLVLTLFFMASCSSRDSFDESSGPDFNPGDCTRNACSEDGRSVLGCQGEVVKTCDADSLCSSGECVRGCEAADKAQSSIGCEFYVAKPSARHLFANYDTSCYAVMVANTWDFPVTLDVDYDGQSISSSYFRIPRGSGKNIRYELLPDGKLPKDEIAVLFLAQQLKQPGGAIDDTYMACPADVGAAIIGQTEVRGSGYGRTFHVRSSAPVIAYDIYPYGGAASYVPSSSLLLPTSAWSTDNLAMDGWSADAQSAQQGSLPYFQILAREDDTHVRMVPTTTLSSAGGAPQLPKDQLAELVLQRGQFVQFTQVGEVNGTPVAADKPISLVGGASCIGLPNDKAACDSLHQQLPPIRLLGDTYVATRYRDREGPAEPETTPWRILAASNGTTLTYDPPVEGAPTTLARGEWAEFWSPGPFVVRSQDKDHPIYVASYMTGGSLISTNQGDPEFVNVVPVGQFLPSYVFLTDPTYGNTNLVFVRGQVDGKYEDVELDCLGTLTDWKSVGNSGFQITYVDVTKKGLAQGRCDNGMHRASGKAPFGLTVWGWDSFASYGFPAGMGTKTLNDVGAIPVN